MESQPQNPEFKNNPEHFHPCECVNKNNFLISQPKHMLRTLKRTISQKNKGFFGFIKCLVQDDVIDGYVQ